MTGGKDVNGMGQIDIKAIKQQLDSIDFLVYEISFIRDELKEKDNAGRLDEVGQAQLKLIEHLYKYC